MPITFNDIVTRDFLLGVIRLHILHHATEGPVFGLDLMRELAAHGYELSPGTLYPMLHSLAAHGFLTVEKQTVGGKVRKYYRATPAGEEALAAARAQIEELLREIGVEHRDPPARQEAPACA